MQLPSHSRKTSQISDPSNNILLNDCLKALNNSNKYNKGFETGPTSPAFNSNSNLGEHTLAISPKATTKTPLVNVPTFNDLDNQQFTNENNQVFSRYQSIFQKRNDNLPNVLKEQRGKMEFNSAHNRSNVRTGSQNSSEIHPVRSNQSKRAQPSQSRDNQGKDRKHKQQLMTTRARNITTIDNVYLGERKKSTPKVIKKQMSASRSPARSPTPNKLKYEPANATDQSSLTKNLNMVSSDTIQDKSQSPAMKGRRYSNSYMGKHNNEDLPDFKKINKCPYPEANQKFNVYQISQILPKAHTQTKHSSQALHRVRIPSIAQQFKLTQEQSRFNLKTREEHVSKIQLDRVDNSKFDVSIDLSQGGITQNLAMIQNQIQKNAEAVAKAQLPQLRANTKLNSNFLAQAEILRVKPDGFRRVSIETDPEFAYGNVPMTATNLTNPISPEDTILERPRFTAENDDDDLPEPASPNDEDDLSMRGMTPSPSKELLPKRRKIPKPGMQITGPVIQSKGENVRPPMDFLNKDAAITPSIKKALRERANFYRRKLTFYENLGVLAVSLTSDEMSYKIQEAKNDLKSSINTQNSMLTKIEREIQGKADNLLNMNSQSTAAKENKEDGIRKLSQIQGNDQVIEKKRETLEARHNSRPLQHRNNRFQTLSEMADFNALSMTKRTSQSPQTRPFEHSEEPKHHFHLTTMQHRTARESSDNESILPANLRDSLKELQYEYRKKGSARSSFNQLLSAWNNTTTEKSANKLSKPIGTADAWGNIILKQKAIQGIESGTSVVDQFTQHRKELKQRSHTINHDDHLPKTKIKRLPTNRIKLENKLKAESASPTEAANKLHLRINRVSPPNKTMTTFEPVLLFKKNVVSTKNRLTPLKMRPDDKPSLLNKEKAEKLVILAKLIKNM